MTDSKLTAILTKAFAEAIKKVGLASFKQTSMFASNESASVKLKKAA